MRLIGIILTLLAVLLLADELLSPLLRPLIDPGYSGYSIDPTNLMGPALLLIAGLLLVKFRRQTRSAAQDPSEPAL